MNTVKYRSLKHLLGFILVLSSFLVIGDFESAFPKVNLTSRHITAAQKSGEQLHLILGNPSHATRSETNPNNYLVVKEQYVLSYNRDNGGPNWVSWHVVKTDLGRGRSGNFAVDKALPESWWVFPNVYLNTAYDRGQMCSPSDRNSDPVDNRATFLMSNVLPQRPDLNRGPWRKFEEYSRDLVVNGNYELYVIAGGSGSEGSIANQVNVPSRFWKVILILPDGDNDLNRIDKNTRVLAVDMPNQQGIGQQNWTKYLTSVDKLEELSGYDFLSNLPEKIQKVIEARDYSVVTHRK